MPRGTETILTRRQPGARRWGQPVQRAINAVPRLAVYSAGALPGVWTFWLAVNNNLGPDPIKALEHTLGHWAIRFVIVALAISPLRRLTGISLLRFRRAVGLLAFFYVAAHLSVYLILDQGLDAGAIVGDILKRPYITIGMFAFAVLVPLAATSNNAAIRRLGADAWARLHRWVYVAAIAAAAHYLMAVKSWPAEPVIYAIIIAILLAFRAVLAVRRRLSAP